jgi:hypothetical protein
MKRILVLGDSITFGHGCSDRQYYWDEKNSQYVGDLDSFRNGPSKYCWAQCMQDELGYAVTNLSRSGNNNTNIAWQCMQAVYENKQQFDHIIAAFSYDDRLEFYYPDSRKIISSSVLSPPPMLLNKHPRWDQAIKLFAEELYHAAWGVKLSHMAINTVANIARETGAQFNWSAPEFNQTESGSSISPALRSTQIPSMTKHFGLRHNGRMLTSRDTPYIAVDGHPSALAHKEYFKTIIKPII